MSYFERLRFEKSPNNEIILSAMEVVKKFIIKNKLILYGGMAMDLALRLKNQSIYPDDEIPDYDFMSPTHHIHAYKLADILVSKGFTDVHVINAIHITTMKIRVMGEWVADISYIPDCIYKNIETLNYKGLNVTHPYHSVMDQASALSRPFDESPREVIFARWEKDNTRMKLILDTYPPEESKFSDEMHEYKYKASNKNEVLLGWPALLAHKNNSVKKPIQIPEEKPFSMIKVIPKKWVKKYNRMLDAPPVYECEDSIYMHADGIQYVVNKIGKLTIASIPMLIWFFLHRYIYYQDNWAYEGFVETIKLCGDYGIDSIFGDESVSNSDKYQKVKFFSKPQDATPRNAYYKNYTEVPKKQYDWTPSMSEWFKVDGLEHSD